MKNALILLSTALLLSTAQAQDLNFDMTPESNLRQVIPVVPQDDATVATPDAPAVPDLIRYVVPQANLRLTGENDRRNFQVFLTAAQAAAPATFQLGYLNALVVSPEASRLRVDINKSTILSTSIASSANTSTVAVDVPAGILQPGFNTLSIRADERHRTDCSISSTYELWSQIDGSQTFLAFSGNRVAALSGLDDMAATGVDASGLTTIRLVMPERRGIDAGPLAADLVQALAQNLRAPASRVDYSTDWQTPARPGELVVLVASAAALPAEVGTLATEAASGPVAAFAPDAGNLLVLSAPDWNGIATAVDTVRTISAQYPTVDNTLPSRVDHALAVPILDGGSTLKLESVGIDSFSFNGRQYRTNFEFGLPSDFYANKYGQAQLRLKAAYSGEVLPGSQINVFVNGQIASVTPILRTNDTLRDLVIKIPMVNFLPGVNTVEIVAALRTDADNICAPGTVTVGSDQRLLVSGDSEFSIPDFARIAQVPNLAAFAGTAFPYSDGARANLVIGNGEGTLSAALTTLARMAVQTNKPITVKSVSLASPAPSEDALFIGAYAQLPPDSMSRVGVLQPYANEDGLDSNQSADVDNILQRWRSTGAAGSTSMLGRVQHWVADLLNLGPNSLGVLPPSDAPYAPRQSDQALAVQRLQPEGGLWTMLTAPTADKLEAGIEAITTDANWRELSGRVSVLPVDSTSVASVEPNEVTFFETTPWSYQNIRFVGANWLSSHVLAYALGLSLIVVGLTLATRGMLRSFGRKAE